MSAIADMFDSLTEFEDLLGEAEDNASSAWEMDFVDSIREKFTEFAGKMYLSEKQEAILRRIAGAE